MNFKDVKTIFFDLDNTLYDHTRAERTALKIMLNQNAAQFSAIDQQRFLNVYHQNNTFYWKKMAQGNITASELRILRLQTTFTEFGYVKLDFNDLAEKYLQIYTQQVFVFPRMMETLNYMKPKFRLGILSNGFAKIQRHKLANMNLQNFFEVTIFSEDVGAMKPSAVIFREAMKLTQSRPEEIVYVGDSYESDIVGAKAVGWGAVLFNPQKTYQPGKLADAEITHLSELTQLF